MLKAHNDYVFIKEADGVAKTESGFVLSGSAIDRPTYGEVVSAGPGAYNEHGVFVECPLVPGQKVIYGRQADVDRIPVAGGVLLVLHYHQIYGTL